MAYLMQPMIGYYLNPVTEQPCYNGSQVTLENAAHFTFPSSAANIESQCFFWQAADEFIWFNIAPSDLNSFVDSTYIQRQLTAAAEPPPFGPYLRNPASAYVYGEVTVDGLGANGTGVVIQRLWIDASDSRHYKIALFVTFD
jgi:hypothetical protein